ncbi:hypothetical protein SLS53_004745 [Cytospora paraplurivora]|uniref:Uncharacterized protein n=1 Tax=Cytospora paraplurivora TaxID=2898453 RepID=A0AAN9U7L5_9PEZI
MPPKRAATGAAAKGPAKKSKTAASSAPAAPKVAKSKRWSAVSYVIYPPDSFHLISSANIDAEFKKLLEDPEKAYSWICLCPKPWARLDEDDEYDEEDEEDEEEDEDEAGEKSGSKTAGKSKCDNGETCLCYKPSKDYPEHEWVVTYAGFRKWIAQLGLAPLRCPDNFNMYTWNDHAAYGILEVIENLFIDFAEASSWKEQWVICEGLVLFTLGAGSEFFM